jgi:hypothetical protein
MEIGDLQQAERVKSLFERHNSWKASIWLDSAGKGRVVVAINSEQWAFLLPQPDYSIPLDLSPFPRRERRRRGLPGSILSTFRQPKLVAPEPLKSRVKVETGKMNNEGSESSFVDQELEELNRNAQTDEKPGFTKYLEDFNKISK